MVCTCVGALLLCAARFKLPARAQRGLEIPNMRGHGWCDRKCRNAGTEHFEDRFAEQAAFALSKLSGSIGKPMTDGGAS